MRLYVTQLLLLFFVPLSANAFELKRNWVLLQQNGLNHYLTAAKSGDPDAQVIVGIEYLMGYDKGKAEAPHVSFNLFNAAAGRNHADAQAYLGLLYSEGIGIPKDVEKGRDLLIQGAKKGSVVGQELVAHSYFEGIRGFKKDYDLAKSWYSKAAENHKSPHIFRGDAMFQLGMMYYKGLGTPKDLSKARYWCAKAGTAPAAVCHGFVVRDELRGLDSLLATERYLLQREKDSNTEISGFANSYLAVAKDDSSRFKWIEILAERGIPVAQFILGLAYSTGNQVDRDENVASIWFLAAAKQGLPEAQFHLGIRYRQGRGVPQSITDSLKWFKTAADQGHEEARTEFNELLDQSANNLNR